MAGVGSGCAGRREQKRGIEKGVTQVGWESREGSSNKYYTRSRRVGGRVLREYIGCGPAAGAIAALDAEDRRLREEQLEKHREEVAAAEAIDQQLKELAELSSLLIEAELLKAGYHKHKGEWRKQRV